MIELRKKHIELITYGQRTLRLLENGLSQLELYHNGMRLSANFNNTNAPILLGKTGNIVLTNAQLVSEFRIILDSDRFVIQVQSESSG